MSLSLNYSSSRPSLSLNFIQGETLDPRITFTRNSVSTRYNSSGVLETIANNQPRFDYDPLTFAPKGLLIEEARTNIIRNNTMVGANASPSTLPSFGWGTYTTITGLTTTVTGVGTEDGINYFDYRIQGTPNSSSSFLLLPEGTVTSIANNQTWTLSSYLKISGGSTTNVVSFGLGFDEKDASFGYIKSAGTLSFPLTTSSLKSQRKVLTVTTTGGANVATGTPTIYVNLLANSPVDVTLRVGMPQLEQGAFATSVIPTTTTAVTRAADVASVNTLSPWFNSVEGTLYSETQQAQDRTAGFPVAAGISDSGSGANTIEQYWSNSTSSLGLIVYVSSSIQSNLQNSGLTRTNVQKVASAYKVNDFASTVGGGTVQTDTSGTIPVVDRLTLGARPGGGSNINGWIRRIVYYPVRQVNFQLQALTAS
jgi:hypothetical protein